MALGLALQRLCDPSSDLQGSQWLKTLECEGFESLELQHLYRTVGFLHDVRGDLEKELFLKDRDLFSQKLDLLVVVDVGRVIELYAEFSRSGGAYTPFPDPRAHRLRLEDLRDAAVRERLRRIWLDPLSLDPARASARRHPASTTVVDTFKSRPTCLPYRRGRRP